MKLGDGETDFRVRLKPAGGRDEQEVGRAQRVLGRQHDAPDVDAAVKVGACGAAHGEEPLEDVVLLVWVVGGGSENNTHARTLGLSCLPKNTTHLQRFGHQVGATLALDFLDFLWVWGVVGCACEDQSKWVGVRPRALFSPFRPRRARAPASTRRDSAFTTPDTRTCRMRLTAGADGL